MQSSTTISNVHIFTSKQSHNRRIFTGITKSQLDKLQQLNPKSCYLLLVKTSTKINLYIKMQSTNPISRAIVIVQLRKAKLVVTSNNVSSNYL